MRPRAYKLLPIEAVTQSPDYYSERDERRLNQEVEKPAQGPLNKLRTGSQITDEERRRVSVYVAVMIDRVPRGRDRRLKKFPESKEKLFSTYRRDPEAEALRLNTTPETLLREVAKLEQGLEARPPTRKHDLIRFHRVPQKTSSAIYSMTWRIIKSDRSGQFLTSDNPVFFSEREV